MSFARREILAGSIALAAAPARGKEAGMHGLIGKLIAHPGKRDELAAIMLGGAEAMPGCLSYIVAIDPKDENALWITEVWVDAVAHAASLKLPGVRAAIDKGRPLIAGFGDYVATTPLGGQGLRSSR